MKLQTKFILFVTIIHLLFIGLSIILLYFNRYLFIVAEVIILLSVFITIQLYRDFMLPLKLIAAGIESIKDKDFSSKIVHGRTDELGLLLDVYNNMIEQLRSERIKQREQHFFLERLINASPSGIIILDFHDQVEMINPAARAMLGDESGEYIGRKTDDFDRLPGTEMHDLKPGESKFISINGMRLYRLRKSQFIDRGFNRYFILIEELTREILETEKKAYAKVIRMMSHEINNSVGAINSILNSSLHYKDQLRTDDREDFESAMRTAIERNVRLNAFMSNFAEVVKIPAPKKEMYNINRLLSSLYMLMRQECDKRGIKCDLDFDAEEFMINIDIQQIEQVLVNIIKNSIEAVNSDGYIIVRTSSLNNRLQIIDNGCGFTKETRQNIFSPFYSTKKYGQGIGLTLAREILINHGFKFSLDSADNQTIFQIEFS